LLIKFVVAVVVVVDKHFLAWEEDGFLLQLNEKRKK